jgi:hypothetical protein
MCCFKKGGAAETDALMAAEKARLEAEEIARQKTERMKSIKA